MVVSEQTMFGEQFYFEFELNNGKSKKGQKCTNLTISISRFAFFQPPFLHPLSLKLAIQAEEKFIPYLTNYSTSDLLEVETYCT